MIRLGEDLHERLWQLSKESFGLLSFFQGSRKRRQDPKKVVPTPSDLLVFDPLDDLSGSHTVSSTSPAHLSVSLGTKIVFGAIYIVVIPCFHFFILIKETLSRKKTNMSQWVMENSSQASKKKFEQMG